MDCGWSRLYGQCIFRLDDLKKSRNSGTNHFPTRSSYVYHLDSWRGSIPSPRSNRLRSSSFSS
ncbi:hypothetical protein HZS_5127 [Henneguya salminicola]|nr:hypothetical protein HZS_5127 [Henneguya salminicola]